MGFRQEAGRCGWGKLWASSKLSVTAETASTTLGAVWLGFPGCIVSESLAAKGSYKEHSLW